MNLIFFLSLINLASAGTFQPAGVPFKSPVSVAPSLSASVVFSNLTNPRGITIDSNQNILVVERALGVTAFSSVTSPSVGWERTIVVQNENLTQGIQVDDGKLYVSTAGEVILYRYDANTKTVSNDPPLVVVSGLLPDGELTTHTLQLIDGGVLVGSGPLTNIDITARDPSSGRSQVRLFNLTSSTVPPTWLEGTLIAYGIRNPAGFAFFPGSLNSLYIVENGASIDNVTGLTAAFVNDNPADEIELVRFNGSVAKSFGFPDCTTLWNPLADPVGDSQYVHLHRGDQISLHLDPERDDQWCQDPRNNIPPAFSFQAHSVPLDIKFYTTPKKNSSSSLPTTWLENAFVSFHGSFDRVPPTGYGVVRVPTPIGKTQHYEFLIEAANITSCPGTCIRPVGLVFSDEGTLFVSSDNSGELFVIELEA